MKEAYNSPELEITKFLSEDIITTSLTDGGVGSGDETPWGGMNGVVSNR